MKPEMLADGIVATLKRALGPRDSRLAALEKRVAELESKKLPTYAGAHKAGETYAQGSLVTRVGGLWLAIAESDETPGQGATQWRLIVKSGAA